LTCVSKEGRYFSGAFTLRWISCTRIVFQSYDRKNLKRSGALCLSVFRSYVYTCPPPRCSNGRHLHRFQRYDRKTIYRCLICASYSINVLRRTPCISFVRFFVLRKTYGVPIDFRMSRKRNEKKRRKIAVDTYLKCV